MSRVTDHEAIFMPDRSSVITEALNQTVDLLIAIADRQEKQGEMLVRIEERLAALTVDLSDDAPPPPSFVN